MNSGAFTLDDCGTAKKLVLLLLVVAKLKKSYELSEKVN